MKKTQLLNYWSYGVEFNPHVAKNIYQKARK